MLFSASLLRPRLGLGWAASRSSSSSGFMTQFLKRCMPFSSLKTLTTCTGSQCMAAGYSLAANVVWSAALHSSSVTAQAMLYTMRLHVHSAAETDSADWFSRCRRKAGNKLLPQQH